MKFSFFFSIFFGYATLAVAGDFSVSIWSSKQGFDGRKIHIIGTKSPVEIWVENPPWEKCIARLIYPDPPRTLVVRCFATNSSSIVMSCASGRYSPESVQFSLLGSSDAQTEIFLKCAD